MSEQSITQEQKQKAADALRANGVAKMIGMELVDLVSGGATIKINMRDELRQPHGVLHGGITATLIDTAMAFAVITKLAKDEKATTVDLTVHYLRPHAGGPVTCTAKIVRAGRRVITLSAEAFGSDNKLIATAVSTYMKI